MKEYRLWRMTWPEVQQCLESTCTVLVPVGAIEQHGPHMPLDTDVFISQNICELSAKACQEKQVFVPVASPITYAVSWYHMNFPGTVSIPQRLFIDYVYEICKCLNSHGFKKIILVNSHGGNSEALTVASNLLHENLGERIYIARWREMASDIVKEIDTGGIHCDEIETSLALALGQRVEMQLAGKEAFNRYETLSKKGRAVSKLVKYDAHHKGPFINVSRDYINEISDSGIVGDASKATKDLGERILKKVVAHLTQVCVDLVNK